MVQYNNKEGIPKDVWCGTLYWSVDFVQSSWWWTSAAILLLSECCLPVDPPLLLLSCADQAMPGTRLFLRPRHLPRPPDHFPNDLYKVSTKKTCRTRKTFNFTIMCMTANKYQSIAAITALCGCSHLESMNCPPTPPLTQQQPTDDKLGLMLG